MIYQVKVKGKLVQYDSDSDSVLDETGKKLKEFLPVFIPNGDEDPSFFGVTVGGVVYDIYGNESSVTDEDKIKL